MPGTNLESLVTSSLNVRETEKITGYALSATCTGTPPTTANVFAPGCIIIQSNAASGARKAYENVGTAAAPSWRLMGPLGTTNYNVIVARTSGTTEVRVFGATTPYALTVRDVLICPVDDANGTISVYDDGGAAIAAITKGSTGVVKGTSGTINSSVASGSALYVVSTSGDAKVFIFYSTAN